MFLRLLRISAVSTLAVCALAQANSVLGIRCPLGLPGVVNSGTSMSMGGASVATDIISNVMVRNPANLGNVRKTVLSSLFQIDFTSVRDESTGGGRTDFARFDPRQVSYAFPIGALGTIAVGYEKRQDALLRYEFQSAPIDDEFQAVSSFRQTYAKDGGEIAWQLGWGYAIGKWARVGLAYERIYYRTAEARSVLLEGSYPYVYTDSTVVTFRGNGLRLGAQVPLWHFTLGLAGTYYIPGDASYASGDYVQIPSQVDLADHEFKLEMPPSLTVGAAWQIDPRWLVAYDVGATFWSWYSSEGMLLSGELRGRAWSLNLGGQYVPAPDQLTPKYWETMNFRLGARLTQLPTSGGYEVGVGGGIGLPLPSGGGLLDLVFEYGQRRDEAYPQYSEHLFHVGIGINGGRKWSKTSQGSY